MALGHIRPSGPDRGGSIFLVLMSGVMRLPICRTSNARRTDDPRRRVLGCNDDTGISTKNKSPSLSVTYKGYKECTFGPVASRRFPLWSVHPLDENPAWMPASSSFLTEINGLESSGTCRTL